MSQRKNEMRNLLDRNVWVPGTPCDFIHWRNSFSVEIVVHQTEGIVSEHLPHDLSETTKFGFTDALWSPTVT